jgi:hypothetical protein
MVKQIHKPMPSPWIRGALYKLKVAQLDKKFLAYFRTIMYVPVLTRAHHRSVWNQVNPLHIFTFCCSEVHSHILPFMPVALFRLWAGIASRYVLDGPGI